MMWRTAPARTIQRNETLASEQSTLDRRDRREERTVNRSLGDSL
jgi:hypothetical protein